MTIAQSLVRTLHGRFVHRRRVRVLADAVARLLPAQGRVIDVGCGDGLVSALVKQGRPGLEIEGYDVLVRSNTLVPVREFDGRRLPLADGSVDAVLLIDVLHHCEEPLTLLREAFRVSPGLVVVKDHRLSRAGAALILGFMDTVGNRPHGVALPYAYWSEEQWARAWDDLGVRVQAYETSLGLYAFPFSILLESGLHFIAALERPMSQVNDA